MCGIVGYTGESFAAPILLHGLEKLEYRGYDSAGISINTETDIKTIKVKGKVQNLNNMLINMPPIKGTCGIGHTRWATHGEPSDINSHPHCSESKKFSIVHNGIIENYESIKTELKRKGKNFVSQTDTEVIVQLIDYLYDGDLFNTIRKAIKYLKGSFAFAVLSTEAPGEIIVAKKDSPLIIGIKEKEKFLASDIPALLTHTRNIIRLEDNEMAVINKDKVDVFNSISGEKIEKEINYIDWNVDSAEKCGYAHFMQKEIMEQPMAVRKTLSLHIKNNKIVLNELKLSKTDIENINQIYIVACGSAYNAGRIGKFVIEKLTHKPVNVELASEFRYMDPIINEHTLVVLVSQSGETADTLAALRYAKSKGSHTLSIVNVEGSSIANESDDVIYTLAGPEIAVATTKAYSSQLAVMYVLALHMAKELQLLTDKELKTYVSELILLPEKIKKILENTKDIELQSHEYFDANRVFFIGRNIDSALAMEGSLKLKEVSYTPSEAYAAGELKHGTISLIEYKTLVVAISTNSELFDKMLNNIKEVKARDAFVMSITTNKNKEAEKVSDFTLYIPKTLDIFAASLAVVPLQVFAYYIALRKGCNIDKPRNLAKSVTVE